ncbi:MAG: BRCT domain-containing protein [Candidatus Omnitrophica bacterium]|nr:BRCT domain-containing protein [Candidatus Omnitrophota bacterium]
MTDGHGQPLNRMYNRKRLNDRAIDELIGLSRGIIADKIINYDEVKFLRSWMEANVSYCEDPLVNQLYCRVQEMLIDRKIDEEEHDELMFMLKMFTGECSPVEIATNMTSTLPLDNPPPRIEFPTMWFCLTGKFAYGPRRECVEVIKERGGNVVDRVHEDVDYLVIGYFGSSDWIHTPYGRKIERAVELREKHGKIAIISEDSWSKTAFSMY